MVSYSETPTEEIFEGTWEELLAQQAKFAGRRVRLTLSKEETPQIEPKQAKMLRFGMFPELQALTEEDFKSAEWHGEEEFEL